MPARGRNGGQAQEADGEGAQPVKVRVQIGQADGRAVRFDDEEVYEDDGEGDDGIYEDEDE